MARRATLENVASEVQAAAGEVKVRAERAAREAAAKGIEAVEFSRENYRSVFDEIAEEAERRLKQSERRAGQLTERASKAVAANPGLAILAVAATAAVAASLAGWAFSRRD